MLYEFDYMNNYKLDNIKYTDPKIGQGGCRVIEPYMKYQEECIPVFFETPKFSFQEIKKKNGKLFVEIEYNQKTKLFFDFIEQLHTYNLRYAEENSLLWFNKQLSYEELDNYYDSMIINEEGKKKIRLLLPSNSDGNINVEVENENNNSSDISQIYNRLLICKLRFENIKFYKNSVVGYLNIVKINIQKENLLDLLIDNHEKLESLQTKTIKLKDIDVKELKKLEENDNITTLVEKENFKDNKEYTNEEEEDMYNDNFEIDLDNQIRNIDSDSEDLKDLTIDNIEKVDLEEYKDFTYNDKTEKKELLKNTIEKKEEEYNYQLEELKEKEMTLNTLKNQLLELE